MNKNDLEIRQSKLHDCVTFSVQERSISHYVNAQDEKQHMKLISDSHVAHLSIFSAENGSLIGHVILNNVYDSSIEFKRIVIYNRSKGYGRQAIRLLMKHITSKYPNCQRVWLDVYTANQIAQKLYQSEGFQLKCIKDDLSIYEYFTELPFH